MEQLIDAYKQGNLILFVGAGVSMNLGLPSWGSLIDKISEELGYDSEIYKTFGDYPALAEYYKIKTGSIGKLRSWMDREWHSSEINIKKSNIHKLIVEGNFPIIYTTNYDRWIEQAFIQYEKPFTKISSISDLIQTNPTTSQIIKFHGDFDDDESIVLGETSFYERLDFESPLDLKLRADALGKSVLFIGYGLSDVNLRLLFYKLSKMWKQYDSKGIQPKSYIFSPRPNPVQEAILERWGITMIDSEVEGRGKALEQFLKSFV